MDDLIRRQAAIDLIDEYMDKSIELHYLPTGEGIKTLIFALPSAQAERKVGKWIYKEIDDETGIDDHEFCSECGFPMAQIYGNFCAVCGARMEGEDDDN